MRAGLSTIQQTLTPEAATVLNHSIAEAGRRNHGQTTPLHVASTLLASPTGFLRQACIRSHPNSSHPLQCRALELCFSVALERLPSATSSSPAAAALAEPPISNALMAALKRAQAHQRRGCPEQQQQPLLAVKVELEQLIISILDDPSVSRVMREASFSSPAVKATIEQSLTSSNVSGGNNQMPASLAGIGFRPSPAPATVPVSIPMNRNLYLNPRLQQQQKKDESSSTPMNLYLNPRLHQKNKDETSSGVQRSLYLNPRLQQQQQQQQQHPQQGINNNPSSNQLRNDDVKRVVEIMTKPKKKNPILVGELEPEAIRKEIMRRIEKGEFGDLKNVEVISIEEQFASMSDKSLMPAKIQELGNSIENIIGNCDGVIVDLADLKWLVEQPPVSSVGRESVAEMAKLISRFCTDSGKVWVMGTATCETYLRCQVYHPSMETDWDLQAVPITSRLPLPAVFPRMGTNGSTVESLSPLKNNFSTSMITPVTLQKRLSENLDPSRRTPCCPKCWTDYERELAKLRESEKSSDEIKSNLPQWLQNAKTKDQSQVKDQEQVLREKIQELQKKWSDTCLRNHPNYNQSPRLDRVTPMVVPLTGTYKPNMLLRQSQPAAQQPRLQPPRSLQEALQSKTKSNLDTTQERLSNPPRSPVHTDLVLGPKKASENEDLTVKDLLGCISSEPEAKIQEFHKGKFANSADTDSFKKLLKGLMKKAWWQPEAASAIATTVTQCKTDTGSRGSVWLLFAGPDRVAKKKMASVLAEHVCGANPITIGLGLRRDDEETDMGFRGKTVLDRIVEAVRRNPSSVIVLSDIDEADTLVRGSVKRAMERGRLTDSHGREISLGNVVFVLTGNWSTANVDEHRVDEQRLRSIASSDWQLRITVGEKRLKRRANVLSERDRSRRRQRMESGLDLSLDLNLAMDYDEDRNDGSINSSNLTMDQEDENQRFAVTSVPHELVGPSDGAVVFKPADFRHIRREIEKTIKNAFSAIVDEKIGIEVEEAAVENILGGLWFGRTSLEEWAEQTLIPSFHQLKSRLPPAGGDVAVRLESDRDSVAGGGGDWLPSKIAVVVDGVGG